MLRSVAVPLLTACVVLLAPWKSDSPVWSLPLFATDLHNQCSSIWKGGAVAGPLKAIRSATERRDDFTESERRLLKGVWPMDLLEDPAKQARVVRTAAEFLSEILVSDHLHELVVFPGGVDKLRLGWEENVPEDLRRFLRDCRTGLDVARGLLERQDILDKYKWRMDLYASSDDGVAMFSDSRFRNRTMISSEEDSTGNTEQNFLDKLRQALDQP